MKHTILLLMFMGFLVSVSAQNEQNAEWKTYLEGLRIDAIADAGDCLWLFSYKVEQDEYSWRATDREIIRFEKASGNTIHYGYDVLGISPEGFIRSIKCDKRGLPLAAGDFDGILRMNENKGWNLKPSFVPGGWMHKILIADNGDVFTTSDDIVVRYKGYEVDTFRANGLIISMAEDNEGNIWLGTSEGFRLITNNLVKFDGEKQTIFSSSPTGLPPMVFLEIVPDKQGNKWMAGSFGFIWLFGGNKLIKFDDFDWTVYDLPVESIISSIAIQDNNCIWLGTDYGLLSFTDSQWTIFNTQNSELPSDEIYSMVIDDNGTKWIGTENGLAAFNEFDLKTSVDRKQKLLDEIVVYPNPAHDFINLKILQQAQNATVEVVTINGQVLQSYNINNNQNRLDVSQIPFGVYLLRIQTQNNQSLKKFVKQ